MCPAVGRIFKGGMQMADSVSMTPPTKRKREIGSSAKPKEHLTITAVDQEQHTICLNVDGYPVTLICSPQNNSETYQQVKMILLDTVVSRACMPESKASNATTPR